MASEQKFRDLKTYLDLERTAKPDSGYGSEFLRVILSELPATGSFKARRNIGVRLWYTSQEDGSIRPGNKGISIRANELDDFIEALTQLREDIGKSADEILNPPSEDGSSDEDAPF